MSQEYITVDKLEVYRLARKLANLGWNIYKTLPYKDVKTMGDQFIRSLDSIGANIVEGYGRYHFLDKVKFYYIARASLQEGCGHWLEVLYERQIIKEKEYREIKELSKKLQIKLNNFITATKKAKENK